MPPSVASNITFPETVEFEQASEIPSALKIDRTPSMSIISGRITLGREKEREKSPPLARRVSSAKGQDTLLACRDATRQFRYELDFIHRGVSGRTYLVVGDSDALAALIRTLCTFRRNVRENDR